VRAIEKRYPPIGEFVDCEGARCHFLQRGQGRPVVMVHGASSNLREWTSSIFDTVASRHRAIAVDRPGHGWSDRGGEDRHDPRAQARVLHDLLVTIGADRPILVGHSYAGVVVLAYALAYPEHVGGVVFLAGVSHPWPGGVNMSHELATMPFAGSVYINGLVVPLFPWRAQAVMKAVFAPNAVPKSYYERAAIELYRRPKAYLANAQDLTNLRSVVCEMAPLYRSISAPLIAVTGDRDAVVLTRLHTPPLVQEVHDGRTVVLDGVGHMPHHTRPDSVVAAIDELVART
jgi:pimeloyl-ACP methyl ester carboxylesterase